MAEHCFETIDIYEQNATVGGAWQYSGPAPPGALEVPYVSPRQPLEVPSWVRNEHGEVYPRFQSPMYDKLETNIPKSLMKYSDLPFPSDSPLFPHRTLVTDYLEDYAMEVKHLIKFETQVLDIRLRVSTSAEDEWDVTCLSLRTGTRIRRTYDAVAVCNGHYTVPYIPDIPGIRQWNKDFPDSISHSKFYRHPEDFAGKKVVVVGNGASGLDIASQISPVSKHPLLVSTRSDPSPLAVPSTLKIEVPEIVEFLPSSSSNRAVLFAEGRVENAIDAVLFCTGYLYSLPFMPTLQDELIEDGFRVKHVYQHIFHIDHPSLAFLALPMRIIPFPLSECQAAVVARIWSNRLKLPPKTDMCAWESSVIKEVGAGRGFHTLNYPKDVEYSIFLHDWASQASGRCGKIPHRWTEREAWVRESIPLIKAAYAKCGDKRYKVRAVEELGFDYQRGMAKESTESIP